MGDFPVIKVGYDGVEEIVKEAEMDDACGELERLSNEVSAAWKNAITFEAEVKKVQTITDGGIRLTLDLPESGRRVMADLAECQQNGVILTIEAIKTK